MKLRYEAINMGKMKKIKIFLFIIKEQTFLNINAKFYKIRLNFWFFRAILVTMGRDFPQSPSRVELVGQIREYTHGFHLYEYRTYPQVKLVGIPASFTFMNMGKKYPRILPLPMGNTHGFYLYEYGPWIQPTKHIFWQKKLESFWRPVARLGGGGSN